MDRICAREGCMNQIPTGRRSWCSDECREVARKPLPIPPSLEPKTYELEDGWIPENIMAQLRKALRERDAAINTKAALVQAIRDAVTDALATLAILPVPAPPADSRKKVTETAIAVLSDWQLAKTTPTYDSSICEARIEQYGDKVIDLATIQRADHPVRDVRVYLLGDLVEGELIFPGQAHRIDASLYRQVVVDGPRILANFLRKMAANFDTVHVVGVIGNHGSLGGRARKDYHPETNADAMMYEVARLIVADEPRITWAANMTPGERHWYAIDTIGEKAFLLWHGDQVKGGFGGWPWYGFGKAISGWAMGAIPEHFDYSLAGHFHQPVRFLVGGVTHWGSGSTESSNTWAAEMLKAQGSPSQWLLFAHPKRGVSAEYEIHLK